MRFDVVCKYFFFFVFRVSLSTILHIRHRKIVFLYTIMSLAISKSGVIIASSVFDAVHEIINIISVR